MKEREQDKTAEELSLDDPLGIAREPVPSGPADHLRNADDDATVRRRRARAGLDGHDEAQQRPGMGDVNVDPDGAAGIDMGYGGEGTDVKRSR